MTAACDIECAIDLLDEDHTHHAMGEGHFGNGESEICRFFHAFVHAKGAADDERDFGIAGQGDFGDLLRQILRGDLLAFYAKRDFVAFGRDGFQETVSFFFDDERDFGIAFVLRLFFLQLNIFELAEAGKSFFIFGNGVLKELVLDISDVKNVDLKHIIIEYCSKYDFSMAFGCD